MQPPASPPSVSKISSSYLARLPCWAREKGDSEHGEIQIDHTRESEPGLGVVYEDRYIAVVRDPVIFPSGTKGLYLRIFEQSSLLGTGAGVVVLPVYEGRWWLVRHFRHATREWALELPRGFSEPGCTAEENVRREVKEELGVDIAVLHCLGEVTPNTGLLASRVSIWFAELAGPPVATDESRHEGIAAALPLSPAELQAKIREGAVTDGFTLSAAALAAAHGLLV